VGLGRAEPSLPRGLTTACHIARKADACGCGTAYTVPTTTIDKLIVAHGRPQLLKIDVEGHEAEVLQTLSHKIPFVTLEYHCSDDGVAKILSCPTILKRLFPFEVNATGAEGHELIMPFWLNSDDFLDQFPKCVTPHFYGDLIIRAVD
jgi:hypothetical protein